MINSLQKGSRRADPNDRVALGIPQFCAHSQGVCSQALLSRAIQYLFYHRLFSRYFVGKILVYNKHLTFMLVWEGWDMAKSLILNPVMYRETQQEAEVCVGNLWYPTLLSSARARKRK